MKIKHIIFALSFSYLLTSCNYEKTSYVIKLKLIDGSWTTSKTFLLDEEAQLKIDCYSYDCGTTGLFARINGVHKCISQPNIIDYEVISRSLK